MLGARCAGWPRSLACRGALCPAPLAVLLIWLSVIVPVDDLDPPPAGSSTCSVLSRAVVGLETRRARPGHALLLLGAGLLFDDPARRAPSRSLLERRVPLGAAGPVSRCGRLIDGDRASAAGRPAPARPGLYGPGRCGRALSPSAAPSPRRANDPVPGPVRTAMSAPAMATAVLLRPARRSLLAVASASSLFASTTVPAARRPPRCSRSSSIWSACLELISPSSAPARPDLRRIHASWRTPVHGRSALMLLGRSAGP